MCLLPGADAAVFANGHKAVRLEAALLSSTEDFLKADAEMTEITNRGAPDTAAVDYPILATSSPRRKPFTKDFPQNHRDSGERKILSRVHTSSAPGMFPEPAYKGIMIQIAHAKDNYCFVEPRVYSVIEQKNILLPLEETQH
ncbi:hypothetical protein MJT46_019135 [Ovis ammon polii x Ovis aries]|nr:hypothetical protein MJT46_019135 [Ovis ammon polii x Ovis aries]